MSDPSAAVVGAGAVGATVAADLAAAGAAIDLFDRGTTGATGRAAGVCYDAYADDVDAALAARALARFRTLSGSPAPPVTGSDSDPDPDADSRGDRPGDGAPDGDDEDGQDGDPGEFAFVDCPYVWVARAGDRRRERAIREGVGGMRARGRDVELLDPSEMAAAFPRVQTADLAVGAVARDAGHADTGAYVRATVARGRREGARVYPGTPVSVTVDPPGVRPLDAAGGGGASGAGGADRGGRTGADDSTGDHDAVVVAAGAHTGRLLSRAGVDLAVKPYRVQALTARIEGGRESGPAPDDGGDAGSDRGDPGAAGGRAPVDSADSDGARVDPDYPGPMVYDATGGFYCRPHPTGLLAGDGTELVGADPDDYDRGIDPALRASLPRRVGHRMCADLTVDRGWAGLCTATPDRDPLVGAVAEGVYVATGFQGHGFMRAPAVGERLAEAVLAGDPTPVERFDPRRFDGDERFAIREGMVVDD